MNAREPLTNIKRRRDGLLNLLMAQMPFGAFMGFRVERFGDELSFIMPHQEWHIGSPTLPALHGGGVASFLEYASILGLSWHALWSQIEEEHLTLEAIEKAGVTLPKTIDLSIDYLRPGLARDSYARVRINRSGRRYASVHAEAWQDQRDRLFAQSTGHFLMPENTPNT